MNRFYDCARSDKMADTYIPPHSLVSLVENTSSDDTPIGEIQDEIAKIELDMSELDWKPRHEAASRLKVCDIS